MIGLKERVLLVEDEPGIVKGLSHSMERDGYQVTSARDGEEGLRLALQTKPDMIILDLMLPGMDGLSICRELRQRPQTRDIPIIMLTAKRDDVDRIVGLEMGADDYVTKPFNTRELLARMKAVMRRMKRRTDEEDARINAGVLTIDPEARIATKSGAPLPELTAKEFDLLHLMALHPGRVFEREDLLRIVWGMEHYDTRTVDVCVGRLRKKIEDNPAKPVFIVTRWGVGYTFNPEG